jgi:hypothetical protein
VDAHHQIAQHHRDAAIAHLEEMRARKDAATPGVEGAPTPKAKSREEKHGHSMADSFVHGLKHLKSPSEKAEAIREEHSEMSHFGSETPEWMTDENYEPSVNAYWDALSAHHKKLVGKPIQVAKAHVEAHTRVVGGKVVQVSGYETHANAANAMSQNATRATSHAIGKGYEEHAAAAQLHKDAAEAHRIAAQHAPEDWLKKGHEENAKMSEHYAQAHHAKAKAGDQRADIGVDTPQHTPQDLKELENHHDYQGFGYLGHEHRSEATDKALTEAANKSGISKYQLAAHVLGKSGRHMMDEHSDLGDKASHEERVAHFQRVLTNGKRDKEYGIKEYAKDLEERGPAKPATPSQGYATPKATEKPSGEDLPDARVEHKGHVSTVEFGNGAGRAVLHPEHQEMVGNLKEGESDHFEDEQGDKWDVHRKGEHLHFKARGASGLKGKVKASEFQAFPKGKAAGNSNKPKGPTDYTSANITAHDATEASELARDNTPDWQKAHDLTVGAHVMTSFKRDHAATAEAHTKAAEAHRERHEATGNKYHGEAADHHEAAAKYHRDKAAAAAEHRRPGH